MRSVGRWFRFERLPETKSFHCRTTTAARRGATPSHRLPRAWTPGAARACRSVLSRRSPTNLVANNFLLVWVRSPAGERGPYLGRLSNDSRETTSAEALKTTYPGVVRHPGAPPIVPGQPRSLFDLARGSDQHASIGAERSEPNNQHAPNIANETKHACNGPA